jgi:ribonuclease-3
MNASALEQAIGYCFSDRRYLQQALTHRSYGSPHNERLEFLGDSVLNCAIAWALFERFGSLREGDLSRLRASLVRQETLHRIADSLQLGGCLCLGEGELKSGGFRRPSILADALEALFGAVLLDGGFNTARALIVHLYQPLLDQLDPGKPGKDPKTALQELLQGRRHGLPHYVLKARRGEAHAQEFEVECQLPDLGLVSVGIGSSRRGAEQQAAQRALELLAEHR